MLKKILLVLAIFLFVFPVVYALVCPEPVFEVSSLSLNGLIFVGGFAKVTGIFTSMKGKAGNAVYQTWKGIQVLRTHVIPANPQSPGQTTNRGLLNDLVQLFKPLLAVLVHVFWNPFTCTRETGWGNLIGVNQLAGAGADLDFSKIQVSKGSLPGEFIGDATYDTATGTTTVHFLNSGSAGSSDDDHVDVLVFDEVNKKWYSQFEKSARSALVETLDIPAGLDPSEVHCYLFFHTGSISTPPVTIVSDSNYSSCVAP